MPAAFDDIEPYALGGNGNGNTGGAAENGVFVLSHTQEITDGTLDLDFLHDVIQNPAIRGIEILSAGGAVPIDTVNGVGVAGGDFSTDAAVPTSVLFPANGAATIVSNLEGGHNDRDFITVTIPDGQRLADIVLDDYVADPGNAGFLGLKLGSDFVVDPAIPDVGITPDGVVEPGDLEGGYVFNETDIGTDLLPKLNAPSFGFGGFDEDALTGDVTVWLNQGGDGSQATLTFVTEDIPTTGSDIVAAINAGGPALTQDGIDFAADNSFLNGTPFTDGGGGNGQQPVFDGTIYETERYGGAAAEPLSYEIAVGPGDYTVELYFAEIFQSDPGARVFDVLVEGQLVLDDYDILVANGGDINQPVVFTVPGTFSPDIFGNLGALDIDFTASADNAKVSGIVVRDVTVPAPTGGAAIFTINDNSNNIEASNFGNNAFQITNTGLKDISFIEIDVTDALFPDAVFDPFGLAGDQTSKQFTLNNGSDGGTGFVSVEYIGAGGTAGYEKIRVEFNDFNPNETIAFGVDMDPNSIAGAQKATLDDGAFLVGATGGQSEWDVGGIGGAELAGSLFTVGYTDATTSTGQLQGQGTGQQIGATALSSQDSPGLAVDLQVNGLGTRRRRHLQRRRTDDHRAGPGGRNGARPGVEGLHRALHQRVRQQRRPDPPGLCCPARRPDRGARGERLPRQQRRRDALCRRRARRDGPGHFGTVRLLAGCRLRPFRAGPEQRLRHARRIPAPARHRRKCHRPGNRPIARPRHLTDPPDLRRERRAGDRPDRRHRCR